jgi:hypothetical protein
MKKTLLLTLALATICYGLAWAIRVNPASNVIADSEATAETILLRDASGAAAIGTLTVETAITVPAGSIDTTKITGTFIGSDLGSGIIDTIKLKSSGMTGTGTLLCATADGKIGKCSAVGESPDTGKTCPCTAL